MKKLAILTLSLLNSLTGLAMESDLEVSLQLMRDIWNAPLEEEDLPEDLQRRIDAYCKETEDRLLVIMAEKPKNTPVGPKVELAAEIKIEEKPKEEAPKEMKLDGEMISKKSVKKDIQIDPDLEQLQNLLILLPDPGTLTGDEWKQSFGNIYIALQSILELWGKKQNLFEKVSLTHLVHFAHYVCKYMPTLDTSIFEQQWLAVTQKTLQKASPQALVGALYCSQEFEHPSQVPWFSQWKKAYFRNQVLRNADFSNLLQALRFFAFSMDPNFEAPQHKDYHVLVQCMQDISLDNVSPQNASRLLYCFKGLTIRPSSNFLQKITKIAVDQMATLQHEELVSLFICSVNLRVPGVSKWIRKWENFVIQLPIPLSPELTTGCLYSYFVAKMLPSPEICSYLTPNITVKWMRDHMNQSFGLLPFKIWIVQNGSFEHLNAISKLLTPTRVECLDLPEDVELKVDKALKEIAESVDSRRATLDIQKNIQPYDCPYPVDYYFPARKVIIGGRKTYSKTGPRLELAAKRHVLVLTNENYKYLYSTDNGFDQGPHGIALRDLFETNGYSITIITFDYIRTTPIKTLKEYLNETVNQWRKT